MANDYSSLESDLDTNMFDVVYIGVQGHPLRAERIIGLGKMPNVHEPQAANVPELPREGSRIVDGRSNDENGNPPPLNRVAKHRTVHPR
jgi:hypothetical protein